MKANRREQGSAGNANGFSSIPAFACRELADARGRDFTQTCLPSRSSPQASEGWLGLRDDLRTWVVANAV